MDKDEFIKKWAIHNREGMLKDLNSVVANAVIEAVLKGRAAEREACAKLADSQEDNFMPSYEFADMDRDEASGYRQACHSIADAIRSRK